MIASLEKAGYTVEQHWEHPDPEVDEVIVRVTGHEQDTTIYTHDEDSIERLVGIAKDVKKAEKAAK